MWKEEFDESHTVKDKLYNARVSHFQLFLTFLCLMLNYINVDFFGVSLSKDTIPELKLKNFEANIATGNTLHYYAFGLGFILGGYLSVKINNMCLLLSSVMVGAVCSYLCPWIMKNESWNTFYIVRTLHGAAAGMVIPVVYGQMSCWCLPVEFAYIVPLCLSATNWGKLLSVLLQADYMKSEAGWNRVFYFIANYGIVWCLIYSAYGSPSPQSCWYISREEKSDLIGKLRYRARDTYRRSVPWKAMFKSPPSYAIVVSLLSDLFYYRTIYTNSAKVLVEHFGEDIQDVSLHIGIHMFSQVLLIFLWVIVAKIIFKKKLLALKHFRYTVNTIGQYGSGICLLLISNSRKSLEYFVYHYIAGFVNSLLLFGVYINPFDLSPNYVSVLVGWTFGLAYTLAGMLQYTSDKIGEGYEKRFASEMAYLIAGVFCLFGNLVFTICGSSEVEPYDTYFEQEEEFIFRTLNK